LYLAGILFSHIIWNVIKTIVEFNSVSGFY